MQDVIDFNLLKEYDTALKEVLGVWTKQKAYSINDTIQYKGKHLKCTTAGTSGITTLDFTGLDVGDTINDGTVVWEIVEPPSGGVDLPEWQANTAYTAGKYLVHEGTVYKVVNDFTSSITFSDTNLSAYIAPVMEGATSSNDGKSGIVPTPTTNDVNKVLCGDGTWKSVGGSGLNVSKEILWSGSAYTQGDILTLSDDYLNYDYIVLMLGDGSEISACTTLVDPTLQCGGYVALYRANNNLLRECYVEFASSVGASSTTATISNVYNLNANWALHEIVGIKFLPNPNNYSTAEQEIGTWIDGKPLYQVTLSGNMSSSSTTVVDISTYGIDTVVETDGKFTNGSGVFFPLNYYNTSTDWCNIVSGYATSISDKKLFINHGSSRTIGASDIYWVTIKYTKV